MGLCSDCTRLVHGAARRSIRDIQACQLERQPEVVAAAGVELGGMVGKGEPVSSEKSVEATPRGVELCLGLFEPLLRCEHVRETPPNLRIVARERWQKQRLRVRDSILARVD